ncbi:MAG: capsular biosynthesis protein, partial [Pseudolabrys sp.]
MNGLIKIPPRRVFIIIHDLVATAAAVIGSFYVRFEDVGLAVRWHGLTELLPVILIYAGGVYGFFELYRSKWRFASLPDLRNIIRAASVMALSVLALDYFLVSPYLFGTFFFGKITILLYWLLQMALLSGTRIGYRYFRYTRTLQRAMTLGTSPT